MSTCKWKENGQCDFLLNLPLSSNNFYNVRFYNSYNIFIFRVFLFLSIQSPNLSISLSGALYFIKILSLSIFSLSSFFHIITPPKNCSIRHRFNDPGHSRLRRRNVFRLFARHPYEFILVTDISERCFHNHKNLVLLPKHRMFLFMPWLCSYTYYSILSLFFYVPPCYHKLRDRFFNFEFFNNTYVINIQWLSFPKKRSFCQCIYMYSCRNKCTTLLVSCGQLCHAEENKWWMYYSIQNAITCYLLLQNNGKFTIFLTFHTTPHQLAYIVRVRVRCRSTLEMSNKLTRPFCVTSSFLFNS